MSVSSSSSSTTNDFEIFKREFQIFSQYSPLPYSIVESYLTPPQESTAEDSIPFMPGVVMLHHLTEGRHSLATRYPNPTLSYLQALRSLAIRLFCQNFDASEMGRDEALIAQKLAIQAPCRDEILKSCTWRSGFVALDVMVESFSSHPSINRKKWSGMHIAVFSQDSEFAKFMILRRPLEIDLGDVYQSTPLHRGTTRNPEIIKLLVDAGASLNCRNSSRNTPLIDAATWGNLKAVQILIAAKANLERTNGNGDTALGAISSSNRSQSQEITAALIQAGAAVNQNGFQGRTPLMHALDGNNVSGAKLLLPRSDVHVQNPKNGQSALFYAAQWCPSMVAALINSRADVHLRDFHRVTALYWAIVLDKKDSITSLLNAKGDPYVKDKDKKSALDHLDGLQRKRMEALIKSCQSSSSSSTIDDFEVFKREFQVFSQYPPLPYSIVEGYLAPPQESTAEDSIPFMPDVVMLHHLTEGRHNLAARYPNPTFTYLQALRNLAIRLFCQDFDASERGRDEALIKQKLAIQAPCRDEILKKCTWRSGFVALGAMVEGFSRHPTINTEKWSGMHIAVFSKDSEFAKFMLLRKPLEIDLGDVCQDTPLHLSITRNPEIIKLLVDAKAGLNCRDSSGNTPLRDAATWGNLKAVQILIAAKADLEAIGSNNETALGAASWLNHSQSQLEIMAALIQAGAAVNRSGFQGRTALMNALDGNNVSGSELLLSRSDVHVRNPEDNGQSALFYAAKRCPSMVVPLIKSRANVHLRDFHKRTALFYTIARNTSDFSITSLLQARANPYVKDKDGKSGLDFLDGPSRRRTEALIKSYQSSSSSSTIDDFEVFKREFQKFSKNRLLADLVESYLAPPQVNTENLWRWSTPEKIKAEEIEAEKNSIPFMPAIIILNHLTEGRHSLAARYPNPTFSYLRSLRNLALGFFCYDSKMKKNKALIAQKLAIQAPCGDEVLKSCTWRSGFVALGAMVEGFSRHPTINTEKYSSMHIAVFSKDSEFVKFMLLRKPLEIDLGDFWQNPPLHMSFRGNPEIVQLLVDAKADLKCKNEVGHAPLNWAATCGDLKAVQILIAAKADLEQTNCNNSTALGAISWLNPSYSQSNLEIMTALVQAGAVVNGSGFRGQTPLMNTLFENNVSGAELLLSRSDVHIRNPENGRSALFYAAEGCPSMVVPLIQRRADVHVRDFKEKTALFLAIASLRIDYYEKEKEDGIYSSVKSLLEAKADPYVKDKNGETGLDYLLAPKKERIEALIQSCRSSS